MLDKMKNKNFIFLTTFFFILAVVLSFLFSPLRVLILGFQKGEASGGGEVVEGTILEPNYCMDSDNGIDYYTVGFVDINPIIIGDEAYDYCDNGNLIEYYCSGNERISDFYQCSQGCEKGKCQREKKTSSAGEMQGVECKDSDNGLNIWVQGITSGSDETGNFATKNDYCIVQDENQDLAEFFCEDNKVTQKIFGKEEGCFDCVDGACREKGYEEQPIPPESKIKTCTDSDNGKNYDLKGNILEYEDGLLLNMRTDYCKDNRALFEFYCDGNNLASEDYICQNGSECKDGACMILAPTPQLPTPIPQPSTCSDSDGGINYNVAGTAVDSNSPSGLRDYCVGNTLFEYYCADFGIEGFKAFAQQYPCLAGCNNGACSLTSCPQDTICKSYWPTNEGTQIYVNGGLQASCNLFEVCSPALDKYIEEARNSCAGSSNQKKCVGLYIINALGKNARFMQGYFTPEICCSADINDPVDRDHCRDFSFFGKCDSKEDSITGFDSFAQQLNCNAPISSFRWVSDTDMSQNTCKFITPPAHATLDILRTGTCEDYSVALTTLLRKAGYSGSEIMSVVGFRHIYNLVKFPGDAKYHFIDTTGNGKGFAENVFRTYDIPLGKSRFKVDKTGKSGGMEITINSHVYYDYCSLAMEKCYNDNGIVNCPSKIEIYGCEISHRYYLDSCKVEWGVVKATCDQCWYSFKSSTQIEGCCRIKEWWGQYTKCEDMNIGDLMSQI